MKKEAARRGATPLTFEGPFALPAALAPFAIRMVAEVAVDPAHGAQKVIDTLFETKSPETRWVTRSGKGSAPKILCGDGTEDK